MRQTVACLAHHKFLFILLVSIQMLVISSSMGLFLYTQLNIVQEINTINEKLTILTEQRPTLNQQQVVQNTVMIQNAFNTIKKHFLTFLGGLVIIYCTIHSSLWLITHKMIKKKTISELARMWLYFTGTSLIIFILVSTISYLLIKNAFENIAPPESFYLLLNSIFYICIPFYIVLVILYAFMGNSCKTYGRKLWNSIKEIHYFLIPLGINILLLSASVYLFYLSMQTERFFLFMTLSSILLTVVLVVMRVFWVISLNNIKLAKP